MPSHNLATTIYNLSINWLDDQLGTSILEQENNSHFLIIWTYFLKLGAGTCINELTSRIEDAFEGDVGSMDELLSVLEKLVTNPMYKTKQILDTLCNVNIPEVILKYAFSAFENGEE